MGIVKKNNTPAYSHYEIRNQLFAEYDNKKYKVVMLGDSITERTAWNELLGIPDIANRGMDSDTTEGFYKRLPDIYKIEPELCFIMGGINDIHQGIPIDKILANMEAIINELIKNDIKPIMQSTLYVSIDMLNWEKTNKAVDSLNTGLKNIYIERNILFIDINKKLSVDGALRKEYSCDGIHLSGLGYKEWGKIITQIIEAD